jgi:hypothetical protein
MDKEKDDYRADCNESRNNQVQYFISSHNSSPPFVGLKKASPRPN